MNISQPQSLRFTLSGVGASLGVALGGLGSANFATAQDADPAMPRDPAGPTTLDTIAITTDEAVSNTNEAGTGISRLPATIFETPREIQVIPAEIIRQQQAITLEEALRNVPGITLSTGEGRGGSNGDQFRIRGLAAQGDVYRDGLRDFGVINRDSFNTDTVEVFKGPSGDNFGTGNLGGLINQSSKRAHLENETEISAMGGSGALGRVQIDANQIVGEDQALRFNLMGQKQDVADRDHVKADRIGLAADWGMGIGTGTEWHLSYMYLRERGTPDMGQPMAEGADGIYRPLLEYDVPGYGRSTSYVRSTDRDDIDAHALTSSFSHDMGNGWTLTNDTRLSSTRRDFSASNPTAIPYLGGLDILLTGTDISVNYGAGGGMTYKQEGWGFQNVLAARGEFETGSVGHEFMFGLDLSYQVDERRRGTFVPARPPGLWVIHPNHDIGDLPVSYGDKNRSTAFNAGLFLSDRASFGNGWSIAGAARLDHFENTFDGTIIGASTPISTSGRSTKLSPSLSIIYEYDQDLMGYLTFARTYRPQGADIAMNVNSFESEVAGSLDPERSDLIELGGKINLLDGRLGLTGAIFQITKHNSYQIDPSSGEPVLGFSDAGQARRIRGVELGVSGEITDAWSLYGSYAWLDGKVRGGTGIDPAIVGNQAPGVPRHNISIWTSYALPPGSLTLPGDVTLAGGIRHASGYYSNAQNTARIPDTLSLDAMISYEQDDWRVALNAYNLTDHNNYVSAFSNSRAVPDSGRTFVLSLSKRF